MYVWGMIGNGKYVFETYEAVAVVVVPLLVVIVVVPAVLDPRIATPVVVAVCVPTVPVHVAPVGQHLLSFSEVYTHMNSDIHAILWARSVVQNEPDVQQAPPYSAANVEHEL
jgi:hypothetical protein